ncbi:MAG: hypothetical protein V4492_01285, partial [Chlamydiota bacterium]
MIAECDLAFDQAKQHAKMALLREKSRAEKELKAKEEEPKRSVMKRLKVYLNADLVRLSHILALKQAFRTHAGQIPVEIHFESAQGKLYTLSIDQSWGVDYQKALESKMDAVPSLKSRQWEA